MNIKAPVIIVVLLLAAISYLAFTFTVKEHETAIKLRLGELAESDYEPGIHFKIPLWNQILVFDRRYQTQDSRPQQFLTIEKKFVVVDSFIKWKIDNVETFYRSTGGDMRKAGSLISDRINTALRDEFAKRTIQEVVSGERTQIMENISDKASKGTADLGIQIVDVRLKQIDFPKNLSDAIFQRMRTERHRIASELRAEGTEQAVTLRAGAERGGLGGLDVPPRLDRALEAVDRGDGRRARALRGARPRRAARRDRRGAPGRRRVARTTRTI